MTGIGAPLLIFTLYEGLVYGRVRMRWGLTPAVIAHGLAIFVLAAGLWRLRWTCPAVT